MTDALAKTIKAIRVAAGDSPAKAAEKIGISRQGYMKWEQGDTSNMKLANLITFCDRYKAPIEQVIRGTLYDQEKPSETGNLPANSDKATQLFVCETTPEYSSDEKTVIEGFRVADNSLRRGILALARESIAVFEKRSEQKN